MKHVVIIGVDPSSKRLAAVVTVDDRDPECFTRPLPSNRDIAVRCNIAHRWMVALCRKYMSNGDDVHLFIEDPALGRGGAHATIVQARVNGALLAAGVSVRAATVTGVNNTRWKKVIVGKGNAGKPEVATWVSECWPVLSKMAGSNQDLKDAAAINRYGAHLVEQTERVKKFRATHPDD